MKYLYKSSKIQLLEAEWFTPNTYNKNYKDLPNDSGVYMIVNFINNEFEILYIGCSKNIKQRINSHNVYRKLKQENRYKCIMIYFITTDNYDLLETQLINIIQPKYNTKGIVHKSIGRPKRADKDNLLVKSAEKGTKPGEMRKTYLVIKEYADIIDAIAYWDRKTVKEVLAESMKKYIDSYKHKDALLLINNQNIKPAL